jgi:hypothetical protein
MGQIHVFQNAFWVDECRSHVLEGHGYCTMDIAFPEEKDKFVVIYLDDITVFSRSD